MQKSYIFLSPPLSSSHGLIGCGTAYQAFAHDFVFRRPSALFFFGMPLNLRIQTLFNGLQTWSMERSGAE